VSTVLRREVRILGTWNSKIAPAGHSEWEMVVDSIARGELQVAPLLSHVVGLDQAPRVFDDLRERRTWYHKVVFAVSEQAADEYARLTGTAGAA
jgi:L-iditol 2-dehydrogenase/galactitol-1-phosphate 5-dehydrogenase